MTFVAERIYTPEDLLTDPGLAGYELVDGHLRERPVSEESSRVAGEILGLLREEVKRTREAAVYPSDLGYQCFPDSPTSVRFPDVSVVLASRRTAIGNNPGVMPIPPDLAVEVLSPNDRIRDVDEKVKDYLRAGVALVWIVNPYARHVHIYRADGSVDVLTERDEIIGETVLSSFRCRVAAFFDV